MTEQGPGAGKLSRQQRRAREREKRDANGWIAALGASDTLASAIRSALANRSATRAELEEAIGVSLVDPSPAVAQAPPRAEPERVTIQHILISFAGTGTTATRTREEAAELAAATLARARRGDDFAGLVQELTDDSSPGIYRLRNTDVAPGRPTSIRASGWSPPSATSDSAWMSARSAWPSSTRAPAPTAGTSSNGCCSSPS